MRDVARELTVAVVRTPVEQRTQVSEVDDVVTERLGQAEMRAPSVEDDVHAAFIASTRLSCR
jgi:hypothetical protein